jgi:hypothetical protein
MSLRAHADSSPEACRSAKAGPLDLPAPFVSTRVERGVYTTKIRTRGKEVRIHPVQQMSFKTTPLARILQTPSRTARNHKDPNRLMVTGARNGERERDT